MDNLSITDSKYHLWKKICFSTVPKFWAEALDKSLQMKKKKMTILFLKAKKEDTTLHENPVGWLTEPHRSLPT